MVSSAALLIAPPWSVTEREPPVPPPFAIRSAVALHEADALERDSGAVVEELGEDRLVSLAVRLGADVEIHHAVLGEDDPRRPRPDAPRIDSM
jgi:hypothetical protein